MLHWPHGPPRAPAANCLPPRWWVRRHPSTLPLAGSVGAAAPHRGRRCAWASCATACRWGAVMTLAPDLVAQIVRLHTVEKWRVGTRAGLGGVRVPAGSAQGAMAGLWTAGAAGLARATHARLAARVRSGRAVLSGPHPLKRPMAPRGAIGASCRATPITKPTPRQRIDAVLHRHQQG